MSTDFAPSPEPVVLPTRDYRLPIVALICSLVGVFLPPLMIPGVVLGRIAQLRIRREPDLRGKGLAVTAMAMPIVALPLFILVGAVVLSQRAAG